MRSNWQLSYPKPGLQTAPLLKAGGRRSEATRRDLLEIIDDRYDKQSTLIASQLPVEQWHAYLGDPTLADAILDRLVHNSHRLNLTGESMRKKRTTKNATTPSN